MKGIMLGVLAVLLTFSFGVISTLLYVYIVEDRWFCKLLANSPDLSLPIECQCVVFKHPLSFELILSGCGYTGFVDKFRTSDNEIVVHRGQKMESDTLVEEKLQEYLKDTYQILDKQQITDPKNGHRKIKIVGVFHDDEQKRSLIRIIVVDNTEISVITAPTLWHAQELEFYLNQD